MNTKQQVEQETAPDPAKASAARGAHHSQETLRRLEVEQFLRVGAKAANSAERARRAARLASVLALLPIEDRNLVLATLDEIAKLSFRQRKTLVSALRGVQILMVRQQ